MSILLDQETELILLGRWLVGSDTDDISLYTREIFVNFPGLYKAVVNGLPWDQISKADKSGVRYADIIGYGTESFLYRQARIDGLIAQRSLLIDKLNSADQDERDRLYFEIEALSDVIAGKENTPIDRYQARSYLDELLDDNSPFVTNCIKTGFNCFDDQMDGGIYPGLYVLGAISSMGKTSFMLQLADQIAAQGESVLYFTLEMGAHELIAKSLSRYSYLSAGMIESEAATARSITNRQKRAELNNYQRINVDKAKENYRAEISNNVWYYESIGDIGVKDIRREVDKHYKTAGKAPIVFIDYLQILRPYSEYWTEKRNTDKAITELRKLSRDYAMTIFCISSLNRGSYKGDIEMDAFKESGAIEYGSDVLLALQLPDLEAGATPSEAKANKEAIEKEKRKAMRQLEVKVLKNRSGETGQRIRFDYNAKFNYFSDQIEAAENFTEYDGDQYREF